MAKVLLIRPSNSGKKEFGESFPMVYCLHDPPLVFNYVGWAVIFRIFEAIIHRAHKTLINQETLSTDRRKSSLSDERKR